MSYFARRGGAFVAAVALVGVVVGVVHEAVRDEPAEHSSLSPGEASAAGEDAADTADTRDTTDTAGSQGTTDSINASATDLAANLATTTTAAFVPRTEPPSFRLSASSQPLVRLSAARASSPYKPMFTRFPWGTGSEPYDEDGSPVSMVGEC